MTTSRPAKTAVINCRFEWLEESSEMSSFSLVSWDGMITTGEGGALSTMTSSATFSPLLRPISASSSTFSRAFVHSACNDDAIAAANGVTRMLTSPTSSAIMALGSSCTDSSPEDR